MTTSYLESLTARLSEGVLALPAEFRARHAAYLAGKQNADGGFSGREGESDLYYTAFALRGLAVLDALRPDLCERAAGFLRSSLTQHATVVDLFSLLYSVLLVQASGGPDVLADSPPDWPERVAAELETFRTADGGYAKAAGATSGSTYHTFLVGLCYQLLGRAWPRPEDVVRFIRSRRRDDGGFVELAAMRRGGTNPTAAAIGVLQLIQGSASRFALGQDAPNAKREAGEVIDFLARMASPEGGLRANDRAPLADLLSTFTGSWTLHQLGALERVNAGEALRFALALEVPSGGFRGGLWDEHTDVEYTFYGLGTVALLSPSAADGA